MCLDHWQWIIISATIAKIPKIYWMVLEFSAFVRYISMLTISRFVGSAMVFYHVG
jgi:hypothetical protein